MLALFNDLNFLLIVYFIGGIPSGLLLAKIMGTADPRTSGSGNIGATNMLRVGGKKLGAATLFLDAMKGIIAVYLAFIFFPDLYQVAGLVVIFGHMFSIWLGFKGGKGIATSLGVLLAWNWPLGFMAFVTWGVVFFLFRYSSLAAIIATLLTPLYAYFLFEKEYVISCVIITIFIILSHKENIKRLISGKEQKIGKNTNDTTGDV